MLRSPGPLASFNPPAHRLGQINAVLSGRARRYEVVGFAGPLSIKTVARGRAEWTAGGRRFRIGPGDLLVLNDAQEYSMAIDSAEAVETFCVFFARGYVEAAHRAAIAPAAALLDEPHGQGQLAFVERRHGVSRRMARGLEALRQASDEESAEEQFRLLAEALLGIRAETRREMAAVPAERATTRAELYTRLLRGREYLEDCVGRRVGLEDAAREACLSMFHFHRLFRAAFGQTPHEYVQSRRVERAARLLRTSDAPVELICADCGFASVTSFTTLFRRQKGLPPAAWRRGNRSAG